MLPISDSIFKTSGQGRERSMITGMQDFFRGFPFIWKSRAPPRIALFLCSTFQINVEWTTHCRLRRKTIFRFRQHVQATWCPTFVKYWLYSAVYLLASFICKENWRDDVILICVFVFLIPIHIILIFSTLLREPMIWFGGSKNTWMCMYMLIFKSWVLPCPLGL